MTPRAHVVQLLPLLEWSGAEAIAASLAQQIRTRGFSSSIVGLEGDAAAFSRHLRDDGIDVTSLGVSRRLAAFAGRRLRAALPRRPLLVHAHMFHATLAARRAFAGMAGVRVLSTCHIVERRFRPWRAWLDRWTAASAQCEVCVSQAVAAFQARATGLPASFFPVIENGIDLAPFTRLGRTHRAVTFHVVSVGRLDAQKDLPTLLRAWQRIERLLPGARLSLAGRGPREARLRALARSLGLARVEFLGFVDAIPALLQSADCYVQSSRWEGFGLAVAEAMAAGLPVVVSDVDSLPGLVDDGRTGRVVPAGNDGLFAERMLELARDPALRERLGTAARHEASRRFTVQRMVDDYAALYEKALAGLASPEPDRPRH